MSQGSCYPHQSKKILKRERERKRKRKQKEKPLKKKKPLSLSMLSLYFSFTYPNHHMTICSNTPKQQTFGDLEAHNLQLFRSTQHCFFFLINFVFVSLLINSDRIFMISQLTIVDWYRTQHFTLPNRHADERTSLEEKKEYGILFFVKWRVGTFQLRHSHASFEGFGTPIDGAKHKHLKLPTLEMRDMI